MSEVKQLLSKVKRFVGLSSDSLSNKIAESLVGQEFSVQIEIEKNRTFQTYLRENSSMNPELKELNDVVDGSIRLLETELVTERLNDLNLALHGAIKASAKEHKEKSAVFDEIRMILKNPADFTLATLGLVEEVDRLHEELSEFISLPHLQKDSDFSFLNSEILNQVHAIQQVAGVLKLRPAKHSDSPSRLRNDCKQIEPPQNPGETSANSQLNAYYSKNVEQPRETLSRKPQATAKVFSNYDAPDHSEVLPCMLVIKKTEPVQR